jgi:uncharacterized protein YxjI
MSKLSSLRKNSGPVAVFSSDATKEAGAVFARMASNKPDYKNSKFEKKVFQPIRFKLKANETARLVILDERFTFGMREHNIKGPDGFWKTERCISDHEECPLCSISEQAPHDVALLSVLDLREYKNKNGETVTYSKKVLPVKKNDLASFQGLLEIHGSLRGLVLSMHRGEGQMEAAIGKPTFVMKLTDDDLLEEFGHEARLNDKKDVVIVPANDSIQPWNYDKFYTIPTKSELRTKYNIVARPGSDEDNNSDDVPWEDEVKVLNLEELPEIIE